MTWVLIIAVMWVLVALPLALLLGSSIRRARELDEHDAVPTHGVREQCGGTTTDIRHADPPRQP